MGRRPQVARGTLVAALACLATTAAHANGRIPGATGLALHPTDERQLLLGLSYGLALSRDGGASWTWMCEQQIEGNGGDLDPSIVVTGDGTLVVLSLTNGGVLVSRDDGCSFERAAGPLQGERGVDLTLDPSRPERVLALTSTIVQVVDRRPRFRNLLAQSLDHGLHWEVVAELPDDLSAETVEAAPSDPDRIYVSGTASTDPLQGLVERSDDGGHTWTRSTVELPRGSGSLFLSAIHPRDPDRLWVRVPGKGDIYGVLPTRLWRSDDGGASFEPVADTQGGMLGFALSPDGERVAFGGPLDGMFVAPADGGQAPSKVSDVQVRCLRWGASGLYVCGGEPTDPYGLGHASEPTQGFAPLWHRADTCMEACAAASPLELRCQEPWETIAPLIDAATAVCDAAPIDAGAPIADASWVAPQRIEPASATTANGCSVGFRAGVGASFWVALASVLVVVLVRRPRMSVRSISMLLLGGLFACASDASGAPDASSALEDDFKGCAPELPHFEPGLRAAGERLTLTLVGALPAEPERHRNGWTLDITDLDGAPVASAELVRGQTFMPLHGHDGGLVPELRALSEPGRFQVDRLNFTMRGPWEVRLWLRSEATPEDYVVFHVCVAR